MMPLKNIFLSLFITAVVCATIAHCQTEEDEDAFVKEDEDLVVETEEPKLAKVRITNKIL